MEKLTKTIEAPSSSLTSGSFARVTSDNDNKITHDHWVYCRDSFHSYTSMGYILFFHPVAARSVGEFINAFERKLNHTNLTEFGPTNIGRVTWFKPAPFWTRSMMRRSLFTILLRAGQKYVKTKCNFDEALNSDDYVKNTKNAIDRFLAGYTWSASPEDTYSNHNYSGWSAMFRRISKENVKTILIKKPISEKSLLSYALKRLGVTKASLSEEYRRENFPMDPSKKPKKAEKVVKAKAKRSRKKKA